MTTIEEHMIPDGFKELILDLSSDLYHAFPELETQFKEENCNVFHFYENGAESSPKRLLNEYNHCCENYRPHFFDILYENETLFENEAPLFFLSGVDFRELWKVEDLSEQTRKTLWKYIQLILFKVVENTDNSSDFGSSETFFEAIDDEALKNKMAETLEDIKNVFENLEQTTDESEEETEDENDSSNKQSHRFTQESMPDMENLHEHLSGLFKGKIGRLAEEIMEETKEDWEKDFGINLEDENNENYNAENGINGHNKKSKVNNINDVFSKLLKDPLKLVNLIKKIGNKLESKIKSGEVKESELLQETSEMMKNLKNTPGMKDMEKIFKTFAAGGGMGNDKMSQGMASMMSMMGSKNSAKKMNSLQSQLSKNIQASKQRERMMRRLEEKRKREMDEKTQEQNTQPTQPQQETSQPPVSKPFKYKNTVNKSKKSKKGKKK